MPILANHAHLSDAQAHRLVREVQVLHTLEEVVRFGLAQTPPKIILDVVVQDEYCHDVVMEWDGGLYLAFDTTWLGAVNKVSVWDFKPSAGELLEKRLAAGWTPTATATVDGDRILGHAACLVTSY